MSACLVYNSVHSVSAESARTISTVRNHYAEIHAVTAQLLDDKIQQIVRDAKDTEQETIRLQVDARLRQLQQEAERTSDFGYSPPNKPPATNRK